MHGACADTLLHYNLQRHLKEASAKLLKGKFKSLVHVRFPLPTSVIVHGREYRRVQSMTLIAVEVFG